MFFLLAFFAAGFILTALLSPRMKVENAKAATLDDFNFPRADEGDPVPRFYGTLKLKAPNTIGLANFRAEPIRKKVKTGLFSSKRVITGYKYYADVDLAWALGPGVVYRKMWFGDNLVWSGCLYGGGCVNVIPINLPELYGGSEDGKRGGIKGDVASYCGSFDQPRDPHLAARLDPDVPAYVGVAHTVFRSFWWGNTSQIDAVSMEVAYLVDTLGVGRNRHYMMNGLDMNPICVLYDILATDWGNLGYDPAKINLATWRAAALRVFNEGNGISIAISNATDAKDAIRTILRQISATIYEDASTGLVEIKLIRNDYDANTLPTLGPGQIKEVKNFTKKLWHETNNVVRIKYIARSEDYRPDKVAMARDSSLLRFQGKERPVELTMPGVKDDDLANAIAARELSNLNVPLYSAQLVTNRSATALRPGDVFRWSWPEYGIVQVIMRVKKIGRGTLEDGSMLLDVVQDEFSSDAVVLASPKPTGWQPTTLSPMDISTFAFVEIPAWLDAQAALGTRAGHTRIAAFAAAPSPSSIGFSAYIEDPGGDAKVLSTAPYAPHSALVTAIDRFGGWGTGELASLVISAPSDPTGLPAVATPRSGGGMFLIGQELFAYTTRTINPDGSWTLHNVKRALLDTGWFAHAEGARVWFFDGADRFFDADTPNGTSPTIYLLDETAQGQSDKATAVKTVFPTVGRIERPVAPDYITGNGSRAEILVGIGDTVTIAGRPRSRFDTGQVWFENDAAGTPEDGQTYRISYEKEGATVAVANDVPLPYDLLTTEAMSGRIVVRVEAKVGTKYSIAAAPYQLAVQSLPIIIDESDLLIDAEKVYTT